MANLKTYAGIKDARTQLFNKLYTILEEGIGPDRFFPDPAPMVRLLLDAEGQLRQEFYVAQQIHGGMVQPTAGGEFEDDAGNPL